VVTGSYHDWGYTQLDPAFAGSIDGTVCGALFSGTFTPNDAGGPSSLTWHQLGGALQGGYVTADGGPGAWCGVPVSQPQQPLPIGCGWSDQFNVPTDGPITLTQTADEVTGTTPINSFQIDGVVSDLRLNGRYGGNRFSWWMSPDGTGFAGNYAGNDPLPSNPGGSGCTYDSVTSRDYCSWCGGRVSSSGIEDPGPNCLGGGGLYDGTWFTNLGTITLTQAVSDAGVPSSSVTGEWFFWGSETEYAIAGTVGDGGLSWTDNSILGGAVGLAASSTDTIGHTLTGFAAKGGLWCGVDYGQDPNAFSPDPIGCLFLGCGLSNQWQLFQVPASGDLAVNQLATQQRGSLMSGRNGVTIQGNVAPNLRPDAGSWVVVSGSWTTATESGSFNWYPDPSDQTFAGDFSSATADGGWCGSSAGGQPGVCQL
jgi:hypothetical protein